MECHQSTEVAESCKNAVCQVVQVKEHVSHVTRQTPSAGVIAYQSA